MTENKCPKCASLDFVKTGFSQLGYQRYRCKSCGRNWSDSPNRCPTWPLLGDRPMTHRERLGRMDPAKLAARKQKNAEYQASLTGAKLEARRKKAREYWHKHGARKRRERETAALAKIEGQA